MKNCKFLKLKQILLLFVILLVGSSLVAHLRDRVKTEVAEITDFKDVVYSTGFIVKDEEIIPRSVVGRCISFTHSEGERIAKDSVIAKIYGSSEDVSPLYGIKEAESEINVLEKLNSAPIFQNEEVSTLNQKISTVIGNSVLSSLDHKFSDVQTFNQELLYLMHRKAAVLGKNYDLSKRIDELRNRVNNLNSLEPRNFETIISPSSGEFIRHIDGFENTLDYNNLMNLKSLDFENLIPNTHDKELIGKIVKSETWYTVFSISDTEAKRLKGCSDLYLSIEGIDCVQNVPCKLEAINTDTTRNKYLLIVSCDIMNESIASLRKEAFKINTHVYSGIKVSKSAIHQKKHDGSGTDFGVYIKYGKHLKFKDINILFSNEDFVICEYGPSYYSNENYLQPGDRMVVQGKNLYQEKHM